MHTHYSQLLARLAAATVFVAGAVFPLSVQAQAMQARDECSNGIRGAGFSYTASTAGDYRPDGRPDFTSWNEDLLGTVWFGLVFDHGQISGRSDSVGPTDFRDSWYRGLTPPGRDGFGGQAVRFEGSYDPFKTFDKPDEFAAPRIGLAPRPDDVLRGGAAVCPEALWVGTTANTDDMQEGNKFDLCMTAQFIVGKKTRYPVTVTLPAYIALGDEEYWFGPHYGYITGGINVRIPLRFIPSRYGRWSAGSSADFCYYGTRMTEFVSSIGVHMPRLAAALNAEF